MKGTEAGHQNAEGMASFGVHVERTVGLLDRRPVMQVHSNAVRFECPKISDKLRVPVERPVRLVLGRRFCNIARIELESSICESINQSGDRFFDMIVVTKI